MKFNIGHYLGEFLCDIMPMDCYHIILGRPCKNDKYALHDGILSQYTLSVNGTNQILIPLIESKDEVNCTIVKICIVNGKKIEKEMKKNQFCFSIIPRRPSCVNSNRVPENNVNQVSISGDQVTTGTIDQVPEEIVELLK